jgi:hypothetical protein
MTTPTNPPENQTVDANANLKEVNIIQLRKQVEHERKARQEAEERATRAEKERENARHNPDADDDILSDEPYVDHKSLDRKLKKFEASMDQRIDKKAEEKARVLMEQERRSNYLKQKQDFDQVMTQEMMQKLVAKDPELAETILEMPDGFARQKLVYHAIKAIGLDKKEEPKKSIQETIEKNRRSPYYQPSGGATPPYDSAGDYSDAGKKNAYEKMQALKSKMRLG